jgi:hypothetical protein
VSAALSAAAVSALRAWLVPAVPLGRLAIFRTAVYLFVVVDVLLLHTSGFFHGWADPVWYRPLVAGRWLDLPAASVPLVEVLRAGAVLAALVAATGRLPRTAGWATAMLWAWYQYVAFSYGKVDHDRTDFLVALALLPTVASAGWGDRRRSEAAGFALRAVQVAAVSTYFFSAWAKLRFGGLEWVNSATMTRAVVRRGTWLGEQLLLIPFSLHAFQWFLVAAELTAPAIFLVSERWRRRIVGAWYLFHAVTYAMITIAFWPHLVVMLAFLPLEEYRDRGSRWWHARRGRAQPASGRSPASVVQLGEDQDRPRRRLGGAHRPQTWEREAIPCTIRATASATGTPLS